MLSLKYYVHHLLLLSILKGVSCEDLTPVKSEEFTLEGSNVTLSYKYSKKAAGGDEFYWYRQYPGKPPEFLISHTGTETPISDPVPRLSFKMNKDKTQVDLQISSAAVSDSAVYYCAVRNNIKTVFGSGIKVIIMANEEYDPSYYEVTDNEATHACLATGFSRHNATKKHPSISGIFEKQPAVRISDDSLYNQVAILSSVNDTCVPDGMEKGECTDGLTPDPKVNLVTMTILGLRLLFIKTVVFNVLITLRLWISQ